MKRRQNLIEVATLRHIVAPVVPLPGRTDFSSSADVHIARLKGERPTRALYRKMERIRQRRAS